MLEDFRAYNYKVHQYLRCRYPSPATPEDTAFSIVEAIELHPFSQCPFPRRELFGYALIPARYTETSTGNMRFRISHPADGMSFHYK